MPINYNFDANQHQPTSFTPVPAGTYDFEIINTETAEIKDGKGWLFLVTFAVVGGESNGGRIQNRYSIGHNDPDTAKRAHADLSALCHCVGRMNVNMADNGAVLRGGRGKMRVASDGQYTNIKEVFDSAGNKPWEQKSTAPQGTFAPVAQHVAATHNPAFAAPQAQPQQPQPAANFAPPAQQFAAPPQPAAYAPPVQPQPQFAVPVAQAQPAPAAQGSVPPWGMPAQPAA